MKLMKTQQFFELNMENLSDKKIDQKFINISKMS